MQKTSSTLKRNGYADDDDVEDNQSMIPSLTVIFLGLNDFNRSPSNERNLLKAEYTR